jgi:hypothetical protein
LHGREVTQIINIKEPENIVACRHFTRKRPRNKQLYNSRYEVMTLQTMDLARQWLSSDHLVTPTDRNTIIALQHRNGVVYVVRAKML